MEIQEIEQALHQCGALLPRHSKLNAQMHSDYTFIPAKAFQFPPLCRKLAYEIVRHYWDMDPQVILAVHTGVIPFAAEIARQLEARLIWAENGSLYHGLELHPGDRIVLTDDLLTNDIEKYKPLIRQILKTDARLIGMAALIDMSDKINILNVRQISVLRAPEYCSPIDQCTLCTQKNP
jgi:adenine/guanine phosphoribosyltransferase-like PRPP-binding protein